jgi:hypothetical protein
MNNTEEQDERLATVIEIPPSQTADTRSCDHTKVLRGDLRDSSIQHIGDVQTIMDFFRTMLEVAGDKHDEDKLSMLDWFYSDFKTGFEQHGWWDRHRQITRHHLEQEDGIRDDVNLLDVLEHLADWVAAGTGRSGKIRPMEHITEELLMKAFKNTLLLLSEKVVPEDPNAFQDQTGSPDQS